MWYRSKKKKKKEKKGKKQNKKKKKNKDNNHLRRSRRNEGGDDYIGAPSRRSHRSCHGRGVCRKECRRIRGEGEKKEERQGERRKRPLTSKLAGFDEHELRSIRAPIYRRCMRPSLRRMAQLQTVAKFDSPLGGETPEGWDGEKEGEREKGRKKKGKI